MKTAFLSASIVFDFDGSTQLMIAIENTARYFQVLLAEDYPFEQCLDFGFQAGCVWLYCNGNQDHKTTKMDIKDYRKQRIQGVNEMLQATMKAFGTRALFIFLIFERLLTTDPLYFFAEDIILKQNQRPVIISDKDENIEEVKQKCSVFVDRSELKTIFHSGFSWNEVCDELSTVFRRDPDTACKLPNSSNGSVTMSNKEKFDLGLNDIELLSGDECSLEIRKLSEEKQIQKEKEERENFYKGIDATWWNFFFKTHVCERTILTEYTEDIQAKLTNGKKRLEMVQILHQPGSGGTTLGKHILWNFSQFKNSSINKYRCCIVNNITKGETACQITKLRSFRENSSEEADPVIVLLDNKTEDLLKHFTNDLDAQAYKNGSSKKVFCVVIILSRCSINTVAERGKKVLRHELTPQENSWFRQTHEIQLKAFGEAHVKSLISFNVMKENFDKSYIEKTTAEIMNGLFKCEQTVLQHLSLLNYFDLFECPVPASVFDDLMGVDRLSSFKSYKISELLKSKKPIGLVTVNALPIPKSRRTWNTEVSESCSLLLKDRYLEDHQTTDVSKFKPKAKTTFLSVRSQTLNYQQGVMIVSPLVALAILKRIQKLTGKSVTVLVTELLDFAKAQKTKIGVGDHAAEYFTQVVCSLFKTRETHGDIKSNFSKLVASLSEGTCELADQVGNKDENTLSIMEKCCRELDDPYVGQQLARFYYKKLHRFDDAENEIRLSIKKVEQNPYLYDTLGQIFKEKLKNDIDKLNLASKENVARLLTSALEAMKAFTKSQSLAEKLQIEDTTSSLQGAVESMLFVLEKSDRYISFENRPKFHDFLNGEDDHTFDYLQPLIGCFQKNHEDQRCVEESLIHLEYKRSMIKRNYSETKSFIDDKSLSVLRSRFSKIYCKTGAPEIIGETMQALKDAQNRFFKKKEPNVLLKITHSLAGELKTRPKEKNLLIYIGAKTLLSCGRVTVTSTEYDDLLQYTKTLVDMQRSREKPYIEAFMYLALYHWPMESRTKQHLFHMCSFEYLQKACEEWAKAYNTRFKRSPTLYFVLGNGKPGMDIVDQDVVRDEWHKRRKGEKRERYEVKGVDIFNDPDFRNQYTYLEGTVDASGRFVKHTVSKQFC